MHLLLPGKRARCCCNSVVWSSFNGHDHQHVKSGSKRAGDAVKNDGDDISNLECDIKSFAIHGDISCRLGNVCKI